jgi:glycerol uptake facilitator-like aquaporin
VTSALAEVEPSDRQRFAAEGLGTLLLLAVVVGSGIMAERLAGGNVAIALLANTAATMAGLHVLIEVFGPISGAHFNPAVSMVMAWRGTMPRHRLLPCVFAQLLGAMLGAWLAHAMFDVSIIQFSTKVRSSWGQWMAESVATSGLVLVILRAPAARLGDGGLLHRCRLLVYGIDIVREPRRGVRAHGQRELRRHCAIERAGLRDGGARRSVDGRPGSERLSPLWPMPGAANLRTAAAG